MRTSPTLQIAIPTDELAAFCRKWQIREVAIFGSALRDDFGPDSDVDLLAEFDPARNYSLDELDELDEELRRMWGRDVDFADKRLVQESPHYIRRKEILGSADVIHPPG